MDKMDTQQLIRHIHRSDLTALEKRYLEGLVEAQTPREGMRLIDVDALRSRLYAAAKGAIEEDGESAEGLFITGMLIGIYDSALDKAPTIEAEPVRHGRWIGWHGDKMISEDEYIHYHYYSCNQCHRRTAVKSRYCPNCGARMDGGAGNDKS